MSKKRNNKGMLKNSNKHTLCKPKNIRLDLRFGLVGDRGFNQEFSAEDLKNIMLLDEDMTIDANLFETQSTFEEGDIYALMAEGVLSGQKTGADLGIYDYEPIVEEVKPDDSIDFTKYIIDNYKPEKIEDAIDSDEPEYSYWEENDNFGYCMLAEENPLGGEATQVIHTFKGYLEVTKTDYSILRRCDGEKSEFSVVYVPREYISKYQLRNGDELLCCCCNNGGKMFLSSLLNINEQQYHIWDCNRPWFEDLENATKIKKVTATSNYLKPVINRFGLHKGDNVFVYINKNTRKHQILDKLADDLSAMFDKVVYINPQCKDSTVISNKYNTVKFCAAFNDTFRSQKIVALLGANYVRRLIEIGKSVAVIVDDIDALASLDKEYLGEMPICKTVLGSTKASKNGAGTSFTLISLRSEVVNTFAVHNIFKSLETLGIVIDDNEIDLYNSYRI